MIAFGNDQIRIMGIVYCAMPLIMGVIGFIFFVIFAALYNLIANWVGGMEFEIIDVPETQNTPEADAGEVLI